MRKTGQGDSNASDDSKHSGNLATRTLESLPKVNPITGFHVLFRYKMQVVKAFATSGDVPEGKIP